MGGYILRGAGELRLDTMKGDRSINCGGGVKGGKSFGGLAEQSYLSRRSFLAKLYFD